MQEKLQQQKEFFSILVLSIKSVRFMMVLLLWTGWSKSKSVVLLLHLLQQLVSGQVNKLILSTLRATLTLLLKLNVLCVYSMVQFQYSVQLVGFNHNLKQYGDKEIVMAYHLSFLLTKWIEQVQIFIKLKIKSVTV